MIDLEEEFRAEKELDDKIAQLNIKVTSNKMLLILAGDIIIPTIEACKELKRSYYEALREIKELREQNQRLEKKIKK